MIECVKNDDFWCICVLGMPCKSHWVCVTIFMLSGHTVACIIDAVMHRERLNSLLVSNMKYKQKCKIRN